ncbi:MAG: hypothetical protein AAGC99_14180 [Pseudomonadota bacterium]
MAYAMRALSENEIDEVAGGMGLPLVVVWLLTIKSDNPNNREDTGGKTDTDTSNDTATDTDTDEPTEDDAGNGNPEK